MNTFKDTQGKWLTQSLFLEMGYKPQVTINVQHSSGGSISTTSDTTWNRFSCKLVK